MPLRKLLGRALVGVVLLVQPAWAEAPANAPAEDGRGLEAPSGTRGAHETRPAELLWFGSAHADRRRSVLLLLLSREHELDPAVPDPAVLARPFQGGEPARRAEADAALTRAMLAYLARRAGSPAEPPPTMVRHVLALLDRAAPSTPLELADLELAIVEALGGWVKVLAEDAGEHATGADTTAPAVVGGGPRRIDLQALRRRLVQSADLSHAHRHGRGMDAPLRAAVVRFQERHGLAPDGVVGPRTLARLAESVTFQRRSVAVNLLRRLHATDRSLFERYVEVDVPGFELRLVEGGQVVLRSRVVVGDARTPTPIFTDLIRFIEFNPSWYVPSSIVEEILAKEAERPGYLAAHKFVETVADDGSVSLRQRPGPTNALGRIKFLFPNEYAVYLHDTPERGLFRTYRRSASHGCVRVEDAVELASALLRAEEWTAQQVEEAIATGRTRRLALERPVPIFLDYRTAFVDATGRLHLRPDIYGRDAAALSAVPGGEPSAVHLSSNVGEGQTGLD